MIVLILAFYLLIPALLIRLCQQYTSLDKIGVVVLSFITGIVLTTFLNIPAWLATHALTPIPQQVAEVAIALALPLLVFSMNISASIRVAGDALKAVILAMLSVFAISLFVALWFHPLLPNMWQITGMSVGAYTGGGPNMAAIKTAINGDDHVFSTMITYDILLSALYLLFVMTVAKPLFRYIVPQRQSTATSNQTDSSAFTHLADETANSYRPLLAISRARDTISALVCSLTIVATALILATWVPSSMSSMVTIIAITSFGVLASCWNPIRRLQNSFPLGMYFILVFCFVMGTLTDARVLLSLNGALFAYIAITLIGAMCLHALLCRWFNIDLDTFLIASAAAIMSVPFIPVIAAALKNRSLILPGFAAAILGYVLGNYLGIAAAFMSRWLFGPGQF
ncbi:MAG: DUF819 family protein [Bacterioplanes sp.]|nr:DUF819 family protein [Bacterioplanes sp.]